MKPDLDRNGRDLESHPCAAGAVGRRRGELASRARGRLADPAGRAEANLWPVASAGEAVHRRTTGADPEEETRGKSTYRLKLAIFRARSPADLKPNIRRRKRKEESGSAEAAGGGTVLSSRARRTAVSFRFFFLLRSAYQKKKTVPPFANRQKVVPLSFQGKKMKYTSH